MRVERSLLVALLAVSASFSVACGKERAGGDTTAAPSVTATGTASASAPLTAPGGPHAMKGLHKMRGGGPFGMFFHGAHKLTLNDAQKTKLEELEKDLRTGDTPRDEMKTLHDDLVAGIKAGKVDTAKLDADQAALDKAMKAQLDKQAEGLNKLHATLEPAQRTALVADLRERMKNREERAGKWKNKAGPEKPGGPGAKEGKPGKHHLAKLTRGLDLDEAQQKKVEAVVEKHKPASPPDFEAMKKRMDTLLSEFEKDAFDAKKLELFDDKAGEKHGGFMKAEVLAEIVPILKPEQREKLAARFTRKPGKQGGPSMQAPPTPDADDDDDDDDDDTP